MLIHGEETVESIARAGTRETGASYKMFSQIIDLA